VELSFAFKTQKSLRKITENRTNATKTCILMKINRIVRNAVRAIVVCLRSMVDGAMAMVDGAMAMVDGR